MLSLRSQPALLHPLLCLLVAQGDRGDSCQACGIHKEPNLVDVIHSKCCHFGCNKSSYYRNSTHQYCKVHLPTSNFQSQIRRRRKHKPPGCQDVRNPRCQHQGCFKYANYGPQGRKPVYCVGHKHLDHVKRSGAGRKPGRPSLKSTDSPQGPSDLSAMPTSVTVP
ncbi:hypothetical protein GUITHDRAFT_148850 [Guillardia theta CCMP2712]|uniref:Uncharacterized protein n=1 Tax=Guillardia theta (strain CCMP2712) TaxID=905079 RepID=L1I867_GUITC|nr:hypothetical protein GUITHDRAFT_148850 [Guillardia theta CCMP2712]EKX32099.1 hypothetical protein GUITHDRAFT_148850 [Guillardia theta CCMP2712]|eukprot:XP_005819079.1 hypothetical protein GUITHDRAFT_148850 [Guillardia theta CCMP2712]